jgi:hypothetical protein
VPGGDFLEVWITDGWMPLGHDDLQWPDVRRNPVGR